MTELESCILRTAVEFNPSCTTNFNNDQSTTSSGQKDKYLKCGPVDKYERNIQKDRCEKEEEVQFEGSVEVENQRKLYIMRHAERLDKVFPKWVESSFTQSGAYSPTNLNMPLSLPRRSNYHYYSNDGPITEFGYITAQMIGRSFRILGQSIDQIFCSPALRCVQTAHAMIKMCRKTFACSVNIEPGLFEFLGRYNAVPVFLTPLECRESGFSVNVTYKPIMNVNQLSTNETVPQYYQRVKLITSTIVKRQTEHSTLLIVAHASSLHACSQKLLEKPLVLSRTRNTTVDKMGDNFPYCSIVGLYQAKGSVENGWRLAQKKLPNFSCFSSDNRIRNVQFQQSL